MAPIAALNTITQGIVMTKILLHSVLIVVTALTSFAGAQTKPADGKPTLFLVGDSTVKNGTKDQQGWGTSIDKYFDTSKINVVNRAIGGRSSRSFQTEGRWDKVLEELKPGDFLLIQFGHNDGSNPKNDPKNRGSIRGTGEETVEVDNNGKKEVVHSYGWYMRKYAADAKAKGATPIILSLVPRNDWKDGKVLRADKSYGKWARESAEAEKVAFLDLNDIVARRYEQLGEAKVKEFFPHEHTHTSPAGADVNAQCVIAGLQALPDSPFAQYLSSQGQAIAADRAAR
jgi:lysophospholipase L1-like esterase